MTPASGPRLTLEDVSLRLPEGWNLDDHKASFQVGGYPPDRSALIYLSSFPA